MCISGTLPGSEFLDLHVNSEQALRLTALMLTLSSTRYPRKRREFLQPYIEEALAQKVSVTREVITENPQFLSVKPNVKTFFAEALPPNLFKKEAI